METCGNRTHLASLIWDTFGSEETQPHDQKTKTALRRAHETYHSFILALAVPFASTRFRGNFPRAGSVFVYTCRQSQTGRSPTTRSIGPAFKCPSFSKFTVYVSDSKTTPPLTSISDLWPEFTIRDRAYPSKTLQTLIDRHGSTVRTISSSQLYNSEILYTPARRSIHHSCCSMALGRVSMA